MGFREWLGPLDHGTPPAVGGCSMDQKMAWPKAGLAFFTRGFGRFWVGGWLTWGGGHGRVGGFSEVVGGWVWASGKVPPTPRGVAVFRAVAWRRPANLPPLETHTVSFPKSFPRGSANRLLARGA